MLRRVGGVMVAPVMTAGGRRRRHADVDDDRAGKDRRLMRDVVRVAQQKLESVAPRREGDGRLGLASAEMQVVFIVGDRLVERRERRVDQEMVMSGIRLLDSGRGDAHLRQSEPNRERCRHVSAILGGLDVDPGVRRGRMAARGRRGLSGGSGRRRRFHDGYVNPLGVDRGRMRDVIGVTQQQLQRVRSRRQRKLDLGLAGAEVEMVLVVRDRLVERRQVRIDQQVMMPELTFFVPAGATPIPWSPKWIVVLGPIMAPSLRSTNPTRAPGGEGVGPPAAGAWEKAFEVRTRPRMSATHAHAFAFMAIS